MNRQQRWRVFTHRIERIVLEFLPFLWTLLLSSTGVIYIVRDGWEFPEIDEQPFVYQLLTITLSFFLLIFLLAASRSLRFCLLHRLTILYLYTSAVLMYINRWWGLGAMTKPFLFLFTFIGLVLDIFVLTRIYKTHCK